MKIGIHFTRRGQRYQYLGTCAHITRDDREVRLVVLESRCADCGGIFVFKTTSGAMKAGYYNRRCSLHKAPGRHVRRTQRPSPKMREPFDLAAALL